jgi:hypothetical protein
MYTNKHILCKQTAGTDTPAEVHASMTALAGKEAAVRVEKKPVRRRGWGVSRVLPADRTSKRTCRQPKAAGVRGGSVLKDSVHKNKMKSTGSEQEDEQGRCVISTDIQTQPRYMHQSPFVLTIFCHRTRVCRVGFLHLSWQ